MGTGRPRPVVLDAGALIAFERNDRKVRALVELARAHQATLYAPAGVVAQAWRDGRKQVRLSRLLGSGLVVVPVLDHQEARAVGVLCGQSKSHDIVDASVVLVARRVGAKIVTSDPGDLRRMDPGVDLVVC